MESPGGRQAGKTSATENSKGAKSKIEHEDEDEHEHEDRHEDEDEHDEEGRTKGSMLLRARGLDLCSGLR
jgi:TATA-binding protein-associated factor Taf7